MLYRGAEFYNTKGRKIKIQKICNNKIYMSSRDWNSTYWYDRDYLIDKIEKGIYKLCVPYLYEIF